MVMGSQIWLRGRLPQPMNFPLRSWWQVGDGWKSKVKRYQPQVLAVLGIGAYRTAFAQKVVALGQQPERLANSLVWVLPNPSGLNAHYQLANLVEHFQVLRQAVEQDHPL